MRVCPGVPNRCVDLGPASRFHLARHAMYARDLVNTRFEYLYRNASNYKQWGAVVFAGLANEALERRLAATLESFEFFIADQVRLPELFFQDGLAPDEDRCWHEFSGLEMTTEEPTDVHSRTIEAFVTECEAASRVGWKVFDPKARELNRI